MVNKKLVILVSAAALMSSTQAQPDPVQTAVAEAIANLEAAKPIVEGEYRSHNNVFPGLPDSPLPARLTSSKYVTAVFYSSIPFRASVVVALGGTGNPMIDGKFLGVFAVGHDDGSVTWTCGTAASATAITPQGSGSAGMHPYLPTVCQH